MPAISYFVDIDNCPVFPQVVRAAQRHLLDVYVVTCDYLAVDANIHLILAQEDDEAAREWISTNISRGDISVTSEPALARSCLLRGAAAIAPTGRIWTTELINAAIGAVAGRAVGPGRLSEASIVDPRTFAQRLEITIATARAVEVRPGRRAPGFGRFGLEWAMRSFPPAA
jgi:uncharacterized protein YaiI (UPF0178 family)